MLLEINPHSPEPRKIRQAVQALREGRVIAYPTDTCYGLGCDLFNKQAIEELRRIKGLPRGHRLTFICRNIASVSRYAMLHNTQFRTIKEYLPGPYCFILAATREVPRLVQNKRKHVGVRVPDHAVTEALVTELQGPIVSTTAVRDGCVPHVDPREIDDDFSGLALVLDGGNCGTTPSSVIDLTGTHPEILREGAGDVTAFEP